MVGPKASRHQGRQKIQAERQAQFESTEHGLGRRYPFLIRRRAMPDLLSIIGATDPTLRNHSLDEACSSLSLEQLLGQSIALDAFRRRSENLYEKVRAFFFL